jgi:hypothetical protein
VAGGWGGPRARGRGQRQGLRGVGRVPRNSTAGCAECVLRSQPWLACPCHPLTRATGTATPSKGTSRPLYSALYPPAIARHPTELMPNESYPMQGCAAIVPSAAGMHRARLTWPMHILCTLPVRVVACTAWQGVGAGSQQGSEGCARMGGEAWKPPWQLMARGL